MFEILNQLRELAYNLSWSWHNEFYSIFEEINKDYWRWSEQNPIRFLETIDHQYLYDVIEKRNLKPRISEMYKDYRKYISSESYYANKYQTTNEPSIAYFSAEYGIAKCLKIYSGGLGVLSGDHLKSSSDLGVPLVGIGLAYLYGYFRQYIDAFGKQAELYEKNEFNSLPMHLLTDDEYKPVKLSIEVQSRHIYFQIWVVTIGKIKLYLLDTFVDENHVNDKRITDILYGGDQQKRILQEILLGIGGIRVLKTLKLGIKAYHLNEGHSAFLCLERIKNEIKENGLTYQQAKEKCYSSNIFTTHTPVPAGIDIFDRSLIESHFKDYVENELNISIDTLMKEAELGDHPETSGRFNMAILAINNSGSINGVSKLHGEVSRKMWHLPANRSQIGYITNGIHVKSFISPTSEKLYTKYFGKNYINEEGIWNKISGLPDEEIWKMREQNRYRLIKFARKRTVEKMKMTGEENNAAKNGFDIDEILNPKALTIGFARRFATYKRGDFIFKDIDRLKRIVSNSKCPVQFIFSGKAHPQDEGGKNLIAEIVSYSKDPVLKNSVVFLENYELDVAKELVKGCDIWLNNPRRPLEASGTSGMKVIANGGLNFSILDGWWDEGFNPELGWKIDSVDENLNVSVEQRDLFESESMYNVLEQQIIPLFYSRIGDMPLQWIKMIKCSIRDLAGFFSTDRMVKQYSENYYSKVK
ncbi:glycosyltransferase family 1 protein [soil metagenome]